MKVYDYKCPSNSGFEFSKDLKEKSGLPFPQAYKEADLIEKLALFLKKEENTSLVYLPFCHTVEGEALGADINFSGDLVGPRAKSYICKELEDVLNLPDIDFENGRISQVLQATKSLTAQGEKVVYEVCGPLTILNTLIDSKKVFIAMRKNPDLLEKVFNKLKKNSLEYIKRAKKAGAYIVSYADPVSATNILGPKMVEKYLKAFALDFLSQVAVIEEEGLIFYICPKTTYQLYSLSYIDFNEINFSHQIPYLQGIEIIRENHKFLGEKCKENLDCVHFLGERCINQIEDVKCKKIRKIKLKRD